MSLPPLNPDKTTSGIIVDPKTLERVVPASKRSDGTERKERRIRPGFTPQEDVSRFRSTRAQIFDASKGIVPGAAPKPAPTAVAAASKTKAQKKNDKRKEKRLAGLADEGIAEGRNWDSDEDDVDERIRGDTPGPDDKPTSPVSTPTTTTESIPVLAPPVATSSPEPTSTAAPSAAPVAAAPATRADGVWRKASPAPTKQTSNSPVTTSSQPARAHTPRAGKGKTGPPGLAHEPSPTPSKPSTPKKDEPRVRKEVRVRPGGVGMGLLSERVRRLVVETQESPRRREGSPGTPT